MRPVLTQSLLPPMSPKELQVLWRQLNSVYFFHRLPPIEIQWSSRLTSSAGMFVHAHEIHANGRVSAKMGRVKRIIRLSIPLLKSKTLTEIRRTLAHEMIHQWQHDVQKQRPNHGEEFRRFMEKMNADGLGIAVYHSLHKEVEALTKYTWKCTKCGQAYQRQRRTISTRRHRCGNCQGTLEEIQVTVNRRPDLRSTVDNQVRFPAKKRAMRKPRRDEQKPRQLVLNFSRGS